MAEGKDPFAESFIFELKEEFKGHVVDVEFCCDHVKKAVGGRLVEVGRDFIELVKVDHHPIIIILFGDDNQEHKELYNKIIIPIDASAAWGIPSSARIPAKTKTSRIREQRGGFTNASSNSRLMMSPFISRLHRLTTNPGRALKSPGVLPSCLPMPLRISV